MQEENIVKRACKELGVTQKELAEMLDVPQTTLSTWASGQIPKMANIALSLLLENKEQAEKLKKIKEANDIISSLRF